ncbi:MAG: hypothetical protein AAFY20_26600 [Cyanobacteria bacterium J06639_14]
MPIALLGQGNLFGWWLGSVGWIVEASQNSVGEYLGLELRPVKEH